MKPITEFVARVKRYIAGDTLPTLHERMAARSSEFQLLSLRPYLVAGSDRITVDMQKPYVFPSYFTTVGTHPVDSALWMKRTIDCADDICTLAVQVADNMEIRAAGLDITTREALLEVSRMPEVEKCRHIVFEHPIHKHKTGKSTIVLDNAAAPPDSNYMLVVPLMHPAIERAWA